MTEHQQPLAPLVAAISAAMRAMAHEKAASRVPVAVLHALILLALVHILDHLEQMIRDWQQGLLPGLPQPPSQIRTRTRHRTPGIRPQRVARSPRTKPAYAQAARFHPTPELQAPWPPARYLPMPPRAYDPHARPPAGLKTCP